MHNEEQEQHRIGLFGARAALAALAHDIAAHDRVVEEVTHELDAYDFEVPRSPYAMNTKPRMVNASTLARKETRRQQHLKNKAQGYGKRTTQKDRLK